MADRTAISKKLRFEVFKRDAFACQYCGKTPPSVVLELDHVHPVSKGGNNGIDNLLTACFDCNRGKSNRLLDTLPQTVVEKAVIIAEREEQIKAFNRLLAAKRRREDKQIDELEGIFREEFGSYSFRQHFKESIRSNFLPYLTMVDMKMAIGKACSRCDNAENALKYFCGICWNIRRQADES